MTMSSLKYDNMPDSDGTNRAPQTAAAATPPHTKLGGRRLWIPHVGTPACKNAFALTENVDCVVLQALRPQDKLSFETSLLPLLPKAPPT